MRSHCFVAVATLLGLSLALISRSALAQGYYVRAFDYATAGIVQNGADTGNLFGQISVSQAFTTSEAGALANVESSAQLGRLGAYGYAQGAYTFYQGAVRPVAADANAGVYWGDTLTITSVSLPFGSLVDLRLSLNPSGFASVSGQSGGGLLNQARATGGFGSLTFDYLVSNNNATPPPAIQTTVLRTSVGAILPVSGGLVIEAVATGTSNQLAPVSLVDFAHTLNFYIDPLTPNVSYTTASGQTYFSPAQQVIPEPSTCALVATCLLPAIGVVARRRRK